MISNSKKILFSINCSDFGGAQNMFYLIIKELLENKYKIVVALPKGPLYDKIINLKIETHVIDFSSFSSFYKINTLLKRNDISLINTHLSKSSLIFSLINIFHNKKICCSLHNAIIHEKLNFFQKKIYPFLYYILSKLSSGIIVNSLHNKNHMIKYGKINSNHIKIIPCGIIDNIKNKESDPLNSKFTIGYFGRLSKEKGVIFLLKALKILKNKLKFKCIIVGDGPDRKILESYVLKNNLNKHVEFLGFKSNVFTYLNMVDVLVAPSLNEAFGLSIIEAFSFKKLVIASNIDAIPELITNNKTGLLFPPKDHIKLSELLLKVSKSDNNHITENAYDLFKQKYTISRVTNQILENFKNL